MSLDWTAIGEAALVAAWMANKTREAAEASMLPEEQFDFSKTYAFSISPYELEMPFYCVESDI